MPREQLKIFKFENLHEAFEFVLTGYGEEEKPPGYFAAVAWLLKHKKKHPFILRFFDLVAFSVMGGGSGPITEFEMYCFMRRNGATYKDETGTIDDLWTEWKSLKVVPLNVKRLTKEWNKILEKAPVL